MIAPEGFIFVIPSLLISIFSYLFINRPVGIFFFILMLLFVFFFRDPKRVPPSVGRGEILSPADGKIILIKDLGNGYKKLSIFLALYNVHIYRSPISGVISKVEKVEGKYHPAYKLEASTENKRVKFLISGDYELEMDVIAGVAARRVRVWKRDGEKVRYGDKLGIVMFGSRVDILLPEHINLYIKVGDKVYGGITKIGKIYENRSKKKKDKEKEF